MNRAELLKIAKPILFNTEMVRAILDGRKTETRRPIKPQPPHATFSRVKGGHDCEVEVADGYYMKPPYQPGDILYVRETWRYQIYFLAEGLPYNYKADCANVEEELSYRWRPSIHMPKEAARIFLRVTEGRAERVQDITEEGADAEGFGGDYPKNAFPSHNGSPGWCDGGKSIPECYAELWDAIYAKQGYGWELNPWVWVIKFERITPGEAE